MMPFKLLERDLNFLNTDPHVVQADRLVPCSPDEVFKALADSPRWTTWFEGMRQADWTSEPPHGVGSTRVVRIGPLRAAERFLIWEPGKRLAFVITGASLPGVRSVVEDLQLEGAGNGTRLHYRIALGFSAPLRPLGSVLRSLLRRALRRSLVAFAAHLQEA